jgi:hypothetical protein
MSLHIIDILIIATYIILVLGLGFYYSKVATKDLNAYFLGGNTLKWYMLGLSNASGMFDISGTMWTVSILFIYGLKSAWIPWLWPVWNQVFYLCLSGDMDASVQCDDWSSMDYIQVWRGQRVQTVSYYHCGFCHSQCFRFYGIFF